MLADRIMRRIEQRISGTTVLSTRLASEEIVYVRTIVVIKVQRAGEEIPRLLGSRKSQYQK